MHSLTKRRLRADQIAGLLHRGLGPHAELSEHVELTDGFFNAVYALILADGRELVLKVAPDPEMSLLRYEVDLMHAEVEFFGRAAKAGVPVPNVVAAEPDLGYLFMDRLAGQPLNSAKRTIPPGQLESLRREVGAVCSRLGRVVGPTFGYPRRDGHTRSASWRTSFLTMIDDILADAVEYRRELPASAETIRGLVDKHAGLLDQVTVPALVHFDLWDGNVFVEPDGDGYRVEGIIDGERAFYGDPIAELTSLALFADPDEVPGVLDGFLSRSLSRPERVRLDLYRAYLYLIMVTEGAVRGYQPEEHEPARRYALDQLDAVLARL